jgi:UDP-N-acetyl-D-mannosaminouronate:lipid I N-acetyl-D-mannosaminouronosyltransferase
MKKLNLKFAIICKKQIYAIEDKDFFLNEITKEKKILVAMNAKKIVLNDEKFNQLTVEHIGYPDGIGAVKALAKKGLISIKYPGYLLWHDIIKKNHQNKKFYFIGATEEVIRETVKKLKEEFSNINIVNYCNGYFSDDELQEIKLDICRKKPDIVFVAMNFPRQDQVLNELYRYYPALYMGLGGSLEVYTGRIPIVPDWWIRYFKFEALFRLLKDPRKIKRQKDNLKFLYYYYIGRI